jgi:hypothetical protein
VDLPGTDRRTTVRRGGFPTEQAARAALRRLLEGTAVGFNADPNQTLADYLTAWLEAKQLRLEPTTSRATATTSATTSSPNGAAQLWLSVVEAAESQ